MGSGCCMKLLLVICFMIGGVFGLGVNWGTQAIHRLNPKDVVKMLRENGITKVKLFDADENTMRALAGSDIEVMVAIPNKDLETMNDYKNARKWVNKNVLRYNFKGGVNITHVAVGNEPFLSSYNGSFLNTTFPALRNIQNNLNEAGVGGTIKATVPLNADVYSSPPDKNYPSSGEFRADVNGLMVQIVQFLSQNNAPFTVNIYPFLSLYADPYFPVDYAFFDGGAEPTKDEGNGLLYKNSYDANFDTLVAALTKVGFPNLRIIVGEVGWPTDGDKSATVALAYRFYAGLLPRLAANTGTPLRPGYIEVYLFGLLDEDGKSIMPGAFERHWGIFRYDGQPKFAMDFSGRGQNVYLLPVKNVEYFPKQWCVMKQDVKDMKKLASNVDFACTFSDCTALGYGSSCAGMNTMGNASYAFNMYYQAKSQDDMACSFQGLAITTTQNPSTDNCNFTIQIETSPAFLSTIPFTSFALTFLCITVMINV